MASDVSQRAREALDAACDGLVAEVAAMINATPEQRRALSYAEAEMRGRMASLDIATLAADATAIERERCALVAQNRKEEWDRAIQGGLLRVDVPKQYAVGAMTEAELLALQIRKGPTP